MDEIKEEITLELNKTQSDTFRILKNGKVDPRMVGFLSAVGAMVKARILYPEIKIQVPFELKEEVERAN